MNMRLAIWDVASKAALDNWMIGVGPSNMNKTLDRYYERYHFRFGMMDQLNPHNQFLHTWLLLGLPGVLVLVAIVLSLIRTSLIRKDILLASVILTFFLFSMTASTLAVNKGIVFFTFSFCFLTYLKPSSLDYLIKERSPSNE